MLHTLTWSRQYQYTFFTNTQWSAAYASGSEIQAYLENVVTTYQLWPYIKLQHEMMNAKWDEDEGKWHVRIKKLREGSSHEYEVAQDSADILFTGIGALSRWDWPDIQGLRDFEGMLAHSAKWDIAKGSDTVVSIENHNAEGSQKVEAQAARKAQSTWQDDVKNWGEKRIGVIGVVCRCQLATCICRAQSYCRVHLRYRSSQRYSQWWESYTTMHGGRHGSQCRLPVKRWRSYLVSHQGLATVCITFSWTCVTCLTCHS